MRFTISGAARFGDDRRQLNESPIVSAMKLSQETAGRRVTVFVSGEVRGQSCDCLEHFWDRHVDRAAEEIRVDASGVTFIDAAGAARLLGLLCGSAGDGTAVAIASPPELVVDMIRGGRHDERIPSIQVFPRAAAGEALS
jgi:ABC-type transporter Mla MlaB component